MRKIDIPGRKTGFKEVSLGFTREEAIGEANRCLQCKDPVCIQGCPARIDIKGFIRLISQERFNDALLKIKEKNNLPGVCGRVCPQEDQCQKACILNKRNRPVQIGYLERFVADRYLSCRDTPNYQYADSDNKSVKVAVIGAGPAGLTASADLAKMGFNVFLFEALHIPGGVLVYGIPEFRLPKSIVSREVEYIQSLGVNLVLNFVAGKTKTIETLRREGFKAFLITVGAGLPLFLNIPGENAKGIYSANEFLSRINLMKAYLFPEYATPVNCGSRVGVIGGGNVAFDCARSALRLGAETVFILYRRTEEEMPARIEEIENAKEEGIEFIELVSPVEFLSDVKGRINGLKLIRNQLGSPDASGRRSPLPIKGSEFTINLDTAVIAVGAGANPLLIRQIKGLKTTPKGYISVNPDYQSSLPDIFSCGDIISGSATVINAIGQAKLAAQAVREYLMPQKNR